MLSKVHPGKIIGQIYNYQLGSGTFRKDDNTSP